MTNVRVFYTDGSVKDNGKPTAIGGFAWAEVSEDERQLLDFYAASSSKADRSGEIPTNNRMELLAVVNALSHCDSSSEVLIKSDSAYIVNGLKENWYDRWLKTGKTSTGSTPKNMDLWTILVRQIKRLKSFDIVHVKGHKDNTYNILCDKLAGTTRKEDSIIDGRTGYNITKIK